MLDPKPLPKRFFDAAKELGATSIQVNFQGGSDEGFCYVNINYGHNQTEKHLTFTSSADKEMFSDCKDLEGEIEDWALDAYGYCGAGDGSDYGDDITYDLERNVVEVSEWYTSRQDGGSSEMELVVEGEGANEESQTKQEADHN